MADRREFGEILKKKKTKTTTQRVAPTGGYDFGNKRQYRRVVWKRAAEFLTHRRKSVHVLLMPSLEGDEIDVALSKGFCQQNMHVVDGNPAIVATLKRRYPYIQTYGVDIVRACKRIADKGTKLSFANFDFCTHSEGAREILFQLRDFEADLFASAHMLAITVQRGREKEMALKKEMYRDAIEHFDKWDNHYLARGGRQETLENDPPPSGDCPPPDPCPKLLELFSAHSLGVPHPQALLQSYLVHYPLHVRPGVVLVLPGKVLGPLVVVQLAPPHGQSDLGLLLKREQLLVGHRVFSPLLFAMKKAESRRRFNLGKRGWELNPRGRSL